jgi:hypothetical protein|tara:strand:- start:114 stop:494 length:381 start_codon:yes stop_codon:yes gene_type:complete
MGVVKVLTGTFANTSVGVFVRNRRGVNEFVPTLDADGIAMPSATVIRVDCELGTEFPAILSAKRIANVNKQHKALNLPLLKCIEGVDYELSREPLEFEASKDAVTGRTMPAIARAFYRAPRPTVSV